MNTLPTDPFILLSYINTQLRDNYRSLDELCDDKQLDRSELEARLASIGYAYNATLNKFI